MAKKQYRRSVINQWRNGVYQMSVIVWRSNNGVSGSETAKRSIIEKHGETKQ